MPRDRETRIAEGQAVADTLVGKSIARATIEPHDPHCDSVNVLRLTMNDGSTYTITGGYGMYAASVCDEYLEVLTIEQGGDEDSPQAVTHQEAILDGADPMEGDYGN